MPRQINPTIVTMVFMLLAVAPVTAQQEASASRGPAAALLWFGGGSDFGFTTSSNINLFQIGFLPMVGIRVFDPFSLGSCLSIQYNYFKGRTQSGRTASAQPLSLGGGAFLRYKALPFIFAHLEYQFENQALAYADVDELRVVRHKRHNFFVGGGYSNSKGPGALGFEMLLLYNANQTAPKTVDLPLELRFAITYGF